MPALTDLDNLRILTGNIDADLDVIVADVAIDAAGAVHIRIAQGLLAHAAEELRLALAVTAASTAPAVGMVQ